MFLIELKVHGVSLWETFVQNTFAYLSTVHSAEMRHFKLSIVYTPFIHCNQVLVAHGWGGAQLRA